MKSENDPLEKELAKAGEASSISPELMKLDGHRIMSDTEVPEEEFLLRLFGKPCFPRRDLSAVTGLEKCGKTFFTSMLMAGCVAEKVLELERINGQPLKVMWYDTEQSLQSTKGILTNRVEKLAKCPSDEHFFVFNVRACTYQDRMDYLIAGIEAYRPDMVIIDNVSDLLPSINDAEASIALIDQLMQLSTTYDCNITVVIHLNRTGEKRSLRGWLGTEILHKSFEVYYCEQVEKTEVFSVEQIFTRKYRIPETLYYRITDEGLPEVTVRPPVQGRDSEGKYTSNKPEAYRVNREKVDTFNQKYIIRHEGNSRLSWEWNLRQLFDDAMGSRAQVPVEQLKKDVMALAAIGYSGYYDKVFSLAVDQRIVKTTMDRNGRIVVIAIPS